MLLYNSGMRERIKKKKPFNKFILFGVFFAVFLVAILFCAGYLYKMLAPVIYFSTNSLQGLEFPDVDAIHSSAEVKALLSLAKFEYENPHPGEFYADGVKEPWCADFVSYLYKEAGVPFVNPNTGSWRIPGIYTLREYLQENDAWHLEPDYHPVPGDIVIYDGGLFGGHTNLVLQTEDDYIITIGGNENNQIRLDRFQWADGKYGVQGFGHLIED